MKKQSTYSLLMNSGAEEKGRSIFETAVYGVVVLCMAISGWEMMSTKVTMPGLTPAQQAQQEAKAQQSIIASAPAEQAHPLLAARG